MQPHQVERGLLRRQTGAAAHGAHHQVGQGHRHEQSTLARFHAGEANRGFGHTGGVLPGGDIERGKPVGEMALCADLAGELRAKGGNAGIGEHLLRGAVQQFANHRFRDGHAGRDLATSPRDKAEMAGFLVTGKVAFYEPVARGCRRVGDKMAAHRFGGDRHHVLPRCIAGGIAAGEEDGVVLDRRLDFFEHAVAGGAGHGRANGLLLGGDPANEFPRFADVGKDEGRTAQHAFGNQRRHRAARLADDLTAARIGGDQRRLRGCQRDAVFARSMKPAHQQRPGHADGQPGHADRVLDIGGIVAERRQSRVIGQRCARGLASARPEPLRSLGVRLSSEPQARRAGVERCCKAISQAQPGAFAGQARDEVGQPPGKHLRRSPMPREPSGRA